MSCETASHRPASMSSAASPSGQRTSSPSAVKKVPKLVSISPTTYLSSLSGTRRSGRCSAAPRPTVASAATPAPSSAGSRPPGRAARAVTIRMTSTPSSSTPLKAIVAPRPVRSARLGQRERLERLLLLDELGEGVRARAPAGQAQDPLAQPLEAEEQQRDPDHQAQRGQGDAIDQHRPQHHAQRHRPTRRPAPRAQRRARGASARPTASTMASASSTRGRRRAPRPAGSGQRPSRPRGDSSDFSRPIVLPSGSWNSAIEGPPGTSIGPITRLPPSSSARASAASRSGTWT